MCLSERHTICWWPQQADRPSLQTQQRGLKQVSLAQEINHTSEEDRFFQISIAVLAECPKGYH